MVADVVFCGALYGPNKRWRDVILPAVEVAETARVYGFAHEDGSDGALAGAGATFGGWLPMEDVPAAYASARVAVGVTKKRQQALGMVNNRTFEVLAAGTPLVIDWFEGLEECGVARYLWPVRSPDETRETVRAILTDAATQKEARRRSKNGKAWVKRHATYAHIARAIERVLEARGEKPVEKAAEVGDVALAAS